MAEQGLQEETIYRVVVNHEEQYSIWPADRECPPGWRDAGKTGPKAECLAYIEEVWTDMRPLSLRRAMEKAEMEKLAEEPVRSDQGPDDPRDDLVTWLSQGDHPVEATAPSAEQFLKRIESGYVNIRFTDTRGGTELGVRLDAGSREIGGLERGNGKVRIAGDLTLNYRRVRLTAEVALETLKGFGRLQPVPEQA